MAAALDDRLRRSSAHLIVDDLDEPHPDDHDWHHLRRVLRLRDGERVTVTDGAGRWRECTVEAAALVVAGEVVSAAAPSPAVVAAAAPKGDRLDWLVAKCTELGATSIVVLQTARSVVKLDGERGERQLERLRRIARESSMQSRRVWLPSIDGPLSLAQLLARQPATVVAEPGGRPLADDDRVVAIGPEGGWSPDELDDIDADRRVALGDTVLRVETAAVAAATVLALSGAAGHR